MYQTLKCDPTLISNPTGSGCGEWDAGANFYIYSHHYEDSVRYRLGRVSYPESIRVSNSPTFSIYQSHQYHVIYDSIIAESTHLVGSGSVPLNHTLQTSLRSNKAQYLFKASELNAGGLTAGSINNLQLDISIVGTQLTDLKIKMRQG